MPGERKESWKPPAASVGCILGVAEACSEIAKIVALRGRLSKETVPLREATSSRRVISMGCGELPGATDRADCTYRGPLGLTSTRYVPGAIFCSSSEEAPVSPTCCEPYLRSDKPSLRATSWT